MRRLPAVLCDLLEVGKRERRNAVYTRVLWCLSTQQLPLAIWKESTPMVVLQVTMLLACPDSISTSVDTEGLNVVKRWLSAVWWDGACGGSVLSDRADS